MFGDRRAQVSGVPLFQGAAGETIRISVGVDTLRVHASSPGGAASVGFFVRVRNTPEHLVYCGAIDTDEGYNLGQSKVCLLFFFLPFSSLVFDFPFYFLFPYFRLIPKKATPKHKPRQGGKTRANHSPLKHPPAPTHHYDIMFLGLI